MPDKKAQKMSKTKPDLPKSRRDFLYYVTAGAAGVAGTPEILKGNSAVSKPGATRPDSPELGWQVSGSELYTKILSLDGTEWLIAIDPKNQGRDQKWFVAAVKDARPAKVPWVIQGPFPDYHGVAWYWRCFVAPANPHPDGRYLLRFHLVDYLAEVWLNGTRIGGHEGGEEPFVLDATAAVKPKGANCLAVRLLNPTHEPIDGVALAEVAEGRREYPKPRDNAYNTGGIVGAVELLLAPALRVEDLHVIPDWRTRGVRIRVNVRHAGGAAVPGRVALTVAPAVTGEPVVASAVE
jgi:hypothetical protein